MTNNTPDYDKFRNEMSKKDAIIEAQTKLIGMLEMANHIKEEMGYLQNHHYDYLCKVIDDFWKQEKMNVDAIEQLNK